MSCGLGRNFFFARACFCSAYVGRIWEGPREIDFFFQLKLVTFALGICYHVWIILLRNPMAASLAIWSWGLIFANIKKRRKQEQNHQLNCLLVQIVKYLLLIIVDGGETCSPGCNVSLVNGKQVSISVYLKNRVANKRQNKYEHVHAHAQTQCHDYRINFPCQL